MTDQLSALRLSTPDATLPAYAWPGGYQMIYFTRDGSTICPDCANRVTDDSQAVTAGDVYWEGPGIDCDECHTVIEAAYGDPDAEEEN